MRPYVANYSFDDDGAAILLADAFTHKLDYEQSDFKLGLQIDFRNSFDGTVTLYSTMNVDPEVTGDDFWHPVLDLDAITAGAQGNIFFPITGLRLAYSGATQGDVRLIVLQGRSN